MKNYGTVIPHLTINGKPAPYPVVNERSVRAAAGLMFVIGFSTFFLIRLTGNYMMLNIVVTLFWIEFFLKSVFQPHWSLFSVIGKFLTKNQKPEYVGVVQKRFAWSLGLLLASTMMVLAVFLGVRGIVPMLICGTCLTFMWMESALGVCVGCNIYSWLLKKKLIPEPAVRPVCPGGACSLQK